MKKHKQLYNELRRLVWGHVDIAMRRKFRDNRFFHYKQMLHSQRLLSIGGQISKAVCKDLYR